MIITISVALISAEVPKFNADQCRVLRQAGVDVRDICPQPAAKKQGRVRKPK